jgi:hypothetical protein
MAKKGRQGKFHKGLAGGARGDVVASGHESVRSETPSEHDELERRAEADSGFLGIGGPEGDPFASSVPRGDADDGSVPPMSDIDARVVDSFADSFFESAGHPWGHAHDPFGHGPFDHDALDHDAAPPNPRLMALRSLAVRRRRAQFTKYVVGAVGVCAVVCLAAMVKVVVSHAAEQSDFDSSRTAQALAAEAPGLSPALSPTLSPSATVEPRVAPQGPGAQSVTAARPESAALAPPESSTVPAVAADPALNPAAEAASAHTADEAPLPVVPAPPVPAPPSAPAVTNVAVAPPPPEAVANPPVQASVAEGLNASANASPPPPALASVAAGPGEAAAAREVARKELSRGHAKQSIEAGERAVALDPTDGEAWLVLGAAYQQRGAIADARRCYKACLSQGKRGPRGECSAMLR